MTKTIPAVQCEECGRLHNIKKRTFIAVHGNITIGIDGGIIGNNFNTEGKLEKSSIFCTGPCVQKLFERLRAATTTERAADLDF